MSCNKSIGSAIVRWSVLKTGVGAGCVDLCSDVQYQETFRVPLALVQN